jgi:CBS domain-containing protein
VKRVPVLDRARLIGLVSRSDLLRYFDRPDQEVEEAVRDALADAYFSTREHRIAVAVQDGVVTLTGNVVHSVNVPVAIHLARSVAGVVDVVANLTASGPEPETRRSP